MRLFRHFGSLIIGAIAGGIVVAGAFVLFQLLATGEKTRTHTPFAPISSEDSITSSRESVKTDFSTLLNAAQDFETSSALYQSLAAADRADLLELIVQSKRIPSSRNRLTVQGAIFQRLAALDPNEAVRQVENVDLYYRNEVYSRIFAEWSLSNLEAAVASAGTLDRKLQKIALEAILQTRDDLSDSRRQEIAKSFSYGDLASRLINESQTLELVDDPEAAWNALVGDGFDLVSQIDLATDIAEQWIVTGGFEVLPQILESISGKSGYDILLERLIFNATESRPQEFLDFALGLDESRRGYVLSRISYIWSRTDPLTAAQAIAASKQDQSMRIYLEMILRQWARSNPQEMFEKRGMFSRDVQLQALEYAIAEIGKTNPDIAIHQLNSLADEWDDTSTLARSLVNGWAEADPQAALEWVMSASEDFGPRYSSLLSDVLAKLVHIKPLEAFAIATAQPLLPYGDAIEARLIRELSRTDLVAAVEMLPQVRDEFRSSAYSFVAFALVSDAKVNRALELARSLPDSEQNEYLNHVIWNWARLEPEELFNAIGELPGEEAKSMAAYYLLRNHASTPVLSNEQLDHAKTFLNEEHLERIRNSQ